MDAILNLSSRAVAYSDRTASSNPVRRHFDWNRSQQGLVISNPEARSYEIPAGTTVVVFSGTRSTSIDNTTQFTAILSPLVSIDQSSRYRFTATGGTAPVFRTDRTLTLNTLSVLVTDNVNSTVSFATTAGTFAAVQVGDTIFIPGLVSGDPTTPFNDLNCGYWVVLSKSGDTGTLQLARPTSDFSAIGETVVVTANSQFQAFSAAGLQVGDTVDISANFSTPWVRSFDIVAVNPKWFEITSTVPLPVLEVATPTTAGIQFYTASKRFIRIEADQECAVQLNGDTSNFNRLSPWSPADPDQMGEFTKVGTTWAISIVNRSATKLNATVFTGE